MAHAANPAPLGLIGFGLTTILLNIHNAGLFGLDAMILGMGIFVGGIAQIIAGVLEFRCHNTFGLTAFTSYGSFWLSLVFLVLMPQTGLVDAPSDLAMACYLGLWGLFTLGMFCGTFSKPRALQVVFGSLVVLFALLSAAKASGSHLLHTIAGYEGILCGASAVYFAIAQILSDSYGRPVLPVGRPNTTSMPHIPEQQQAAA
ncbi:MAG: acetate uptake transporter [Planctomycetota bacterium]